MSIPASRDLRAVVLLAPTGQGHDEYRLAPRLGAYLVSKTFAEDTCNKTAISIGEHFKIRVYNIEVNGFHTYYVGEAGVWVHNQETAGATTGRGCAHSSHETKIRAQAKREKAEIFFEDESGVRSDCHSGTTWAPKGKTPVVRVTGQRFSLNMISSVSPRGELRFMVVRGGVGAEIFIEFLKRLVHGRRRPIYLIVDGHPSHRSKKVKTYVESLQGKLRLFFLPPYSPELNPDELVWNDVKNNGVGRTLVHGPADLMRAILGRLRYLQKTPEMVRSFFQHPEARYAACT